MIKFSEFCSFHHNITLLGMSGIGKTILSTSLRNSGNWFHYSADYRIGTRYLSEYILDNVKLKIMQMKDPFVAELLKSDSIFINHNISVDNLRPVSTFLGMYGDPNFGGLDKDTFLTRQELYRKAEVSAMLDVKHFVEKAWTIYRCPNFVNDASGSLCEIINLEDSNDPVLTNLLEQTLIVYILADEEAEKNMTERAYSSPKPLYYNMKFIKPILEKMPSDGSGISPTDFARECFPSLIQYRKPKYAQIGKEYGFTLPARNVFQSKNKKQKIPNGQDFLKNLYNAIELEINRSKTSLARFEDYLEQCIIRKKYREND